MSRADLVLYRRMRGVFWALLVTAVVVLPTLLALGLAIPSRLELFPERFIAENARPDILFQGSFGLASTMGSIAAIILGATAGSVDHQRGVLRDLVLAGRARWRIVVGRLLGAATWLALALLAACVLTLAVSLLVAPLEWEGDAGDVARQAAEVLPSLVYTLMFAAGVAMLVGSRGPAIAVFFVIALIVDNVLGAIPTVGEWWREISLNQADSHVRWWILDQPGEPFDRPLAQSVLVLVGWAVVPFVAGVVRLTRRDL